MPHIDEGLLHAYLDAALESYPPDEVRWMEDHLAGCAECAGRLEEEREIRAAAHGLLDDAAPAGVELASLEALRARADEAEASGRHDASSAKSRDRSPGLFVQLSWAASIVVALSAGWLARDLRGPANPAARFDELIEVTALEAEAQPANEGVANDLIAQRGAEPSGEGVTSEDSPESELEKISEELPAAQPPSDLGRADADVASDDARASSTVAAEAPTREQESSDEQRVERSRLAAESTAEVQRAMADAAEEGFAQVNFRADEVAPAPAEALRPEALAVDAMGRANRPALSPTLPVELDAVSAGAGAGFRVWERPRTLEGEGITVVPELGLIQRYVEVLDDGRAIEFWLVRGPGPSGDAPEISVVRAYFERAPLPDGWSQLFRARDDGVLAARSAMSGDELAEHVDRLVPRR